MHSAARRRLAWWLAAIAVLLRVLVPAGFMPAASAAAPFALVLCTGHGPVTLLVDAAGKPVPEQNDPAGKLADRHPCPFAGLSAGLVPPPASPALPAACWPTVADATGEPHCVARAAAGLPPPATAPPISA